MAGPLSEKWHDRKNKRTRLKNKRGWERGIKWQHWDSSIPGVDHGNCMHLKPVIQRSLCVQCGWRAVKIQANLTSTHPQKNPPTCLQAYDPVSVLSTANQSGHTSVLDSSKLNSCAPCPSAYSPCQWRHNLIPQTLFFDRTNELLRVIKNGGW